MRADEFILVIMTEDLDVRGYLVPRRDTTELERLRKAKNFRTEILLSGLLASEAEQKVFEKLFRLSCKVPDGQRVLAHALAAMWSMGWTHEDTERALRDE